MAIATSGNQGKTALITGASSGIGSEFAKLFAQDQYSLVLVARNEKNLIQLADELSQTYNINVKVLVKDLSRLEAADEIFAELQKDNIQVDVLVNNAGFATYGFFAETDLAAELQLMQVNMVALTHLTKLLLHGMLQRKSGKILNLASTAAFQPGPLMAVYYASKAYVLSFSEAIANEVKGTGVSVTVLCPGPTESGFQKRAAMEQSKLVKGRKIMDATTVAKVGYRGLMNRQAIVVPGLSNQLLTLSIRILPRGFVTRIVRSMQAEMR
jgi:uncharacterized protein